MIKEEIAKFTDVTNALITNARCLTEGVDVPKIDAVLFADPKKSTVDIVQAIGRALRVSEGKKFGYVIIPVLVDETDPDATEKAFEDITLTLRAITSQDDRITDYFRSVSEGRWPTRNKSPIKFDVPTALSISLGDFVGAIETKAWHRLAKLSRMPFEEARKFVRKLGFEIQKEWFLYIKGELPGFKPRPADIPSNPNSVYKDTGWQSWEDWLGTVKK